jgi:hypothetical protein
MNPDLINRTVKRDQLSTMRMVVGNEDIYSSVIDNGHRKDWVGLGWIDCGPATPADIANFPTVVEG